jgi:hypothetical protein
MLTAYLFQHDSCKANDPEKQESADTEPALRNIGTSKLSARGVSELAERVFGTVRHCHTVLRIFHFGSMPFL